MFYFSGETAQLNRLTVKSECGVGDGWRCRNVRRSVWRCGNARRSVCCFGRSFFLLACREEHGCCHHHGRDEFDVCFHFVSFILMLLLYPREDMHIKRAWYHSLSLVFPGLRLPIQVQLLRAIPRWTRGSVAFIWTCVFMSCRSSGIPDKLLRYFLFYDVHIILCAMLHWHEGLVNILFKQVGMCAGVDKEECQLLVVLSPAEQPVWPNMTFPLVFSIAHQFVGMIFRW